MKKIDLKLAQLNAQKVKIEKEILELQKKKNEEFISILNKIPNFNVDHLTLIGGLLNLLELANRKPELKEEWLKAAEKFCGKISLGKKHENHPTASQKDV